MKLLLTGAFPYSKEQFDELQSLGYEIVFAQDERNPLEVDVSEIEAVVCNSLFLYNDIEKFKILKFIQLTSAGFDRVPLAYIHEHGLTIANARGVYSAPMAEWVILKILEIYKNSRHFYKAQKGHRWEKRRDLLELTDKTATIIGYGHVGSEIAKRLQAFGAKVIGINNELGKSEWTDEYFLIEAVDDVLKRSDIVILTLPLTDETNHFLDADKLSNMKDGSVLVNVSRGGVVDETALRKALEDGKFLGVALDVFDEEPLLQGSAFWDLENVIITPHNSFVSDKVNERLFELIRDNLKTVRVTE